MHVHVLFQCFFVLLKPAQRPHLVCPLSSDIEAIVSVVLKRLASLTLSVDIEALSTRTNSSEIKVMSAMNSALATTMPGSVDAELFTGVWNVIAAAQSELMLFVVAMVSYYVLHMQKVAHNQKLQAKKVKVLEEEEKDENRRDDSNIKKTSGVGTKKAAEKPFQDSMQSGDRAKRVPSSSQIDVGKHITMIRNYATEKNLQGAFSVFKSLEEGDADLNNVDMCPRHRRSRQGRYNNATWLTKGTSWLKQRRR